MGSRLQNHLLNQWENLVLIDGHYPRKFEGWIENVNDIFMCCENAFVKKNKK